MMGPDILRILHDLSEQHTEALRKIEELSTQTLPPEERVILESINNFVETSRKSLQGVMKLTTKDKGLHTYIKVVK